jgi:Tfp pilus assembly protein PilF
MKSRPPSCNLFAEARSWCPHSHRGESVDPADAPTRDPIHAAHLNSLGITAFQAGQIETALDYMQKAVRTDNGHADYHHNLAVFLTAAGSFAEALHSYHQALVLRPDFGVASNNLSLALIRMGKFEDALAAAEQAVRLLPGLAPAVNHKGLALQGLGRHSDAEEQFHKALNLDPAFAEAHRNLGSSLVEQGRLDEGARSFRQALTLRPDLADAHIVLADVMKMQGLFSDAVAHLRLALRINPQLGLVWCNLSEFVTQDLCRLSEDELGQIRALLAAKQPSILDRSLLHHALANVHDHHGEYDAAFSHFLQGNGYRKQWLQQQGRNFDAAAHCLYVDHLLSQFGAAYFEQQFTESSASELPIFVVGMPRSGTTLVQQILSSHSAMAAAGELSDMGRIVTDLERHGGIANNYPANSPSPEGADLHAHADRYLSHLRALGGNSALRVVDKTPENFLHLGIIAKVFPQAHIIHCRRDPLDVCLSCYFQNFKGVDYSWSLEDLGCYHQQYQRLMTHWKNVLPLRIMEVRYEDLVTHQEEVSRKMIDFCGLPWENRCLAFHTNPRPVQTVSAVQVRRPMYASSIGRWRKYAQHLDPLRRALGGIS